MREYRESLQSFVKNWDVAQRTVTSRREVWAACVKDPLLPWLNELVRELRGVSIEATVMDQGALGLRQVGIRLDTRSTGLSYKVSDGERALHETFADLVFEQRPSGIVWVLRWAPYIKELVHEAPPVMLAREIDPLARDFSRETLQLDMAEFLKWALDKSYRGETARNHQVVPVLPSQAIRGFEP